MARTLYESIFEKAEARGEARGAARGRRVHRADIIIRVLIRRAGPLDPAVATRIRTEPSMDTLGVWLDEAIDLSDAEAARLLIERIGKAEPA